jgi:hypothetical protein
MRDRCTYLVTLFTVLILLIPIFLTFRLIPTYLASSDAKQLKDEKTELEPLINDVFIAPDLLLSKGAYAKTPVPGYYDTSEYMIGSVAVGIILPESNGSIDTESENWTSEEKENVTNEIKTGLTWWATKASENNVTLTFVYDFHYGVPTSYEPIRRSASVERKLWISETMSYLGYPGEWSITQVRDYINNLRDTKNTDWAYAIFVVDSSNDSDGEFSDGYFAFAHLGGPYVVMTYDNNGYGIDRMDVVIAHETGHTFYATDEYDGHTENSGYLNIPDNEGATCIMRGAYWIACEQTKQQIGWRDSDGDTIQDILDTFPDSTLEPYSPDPTSNFTLAYNGTITVVPYPNNNPHGPGNDVTINTIQNVQYRVNVGLWLNATAIDGAFDNATEEFNFTIEELSYGTHLIEVRGINSVGNNETTFANDTITILHPNISVSIELLTSLPLTEGDTVSYKVIINNTGEETFMNTDIWLKLVGKNYKPYFTNDTLMATEIADVSIGNTEVNIDIQLLNAGYYKVIAGVSEDGGILNFSTGEDIAVRGLRVLNSTLKISDSDVERTLFFHDDVVNLTLECLVVEDFLGNISLEVEKQTNQSKTEYFINGSYNIEINWTIPSHIPTGIYTLQFVVKGYSRIIENNQEYSIKVIKIPQVLNKAIQWLEEAQNADGGWGNTNSSSISNIEDTCKVLKALVDAGVSPYSAIIEAAVDYINATNLTGYSVDLLAQAIWAVVDAGKADLPNITLWAEDIKNKQNWIHMDEIWKIEIHGFSIDSPDTYTLTIVENTTSGNYSETVLDSIAPGDMDIHYVTVCEGTVILNITLMWTNESQYLDMFLYNADYTEMWWTTPINATTSRIIVEFDGAWGGIAGAAIVPSRADYTSWGVIGLVISDKHLNAADRGIEWLKNNQSANGSWEDNVFFTSLAIIAVSMKEPNYSGLANAVNWLKLQMNDDGRYGSNQIYSAQLIDTTYAIRAITRMNETYASSYIRESARLLCEWQKPSGDWDNNHYTANVAYPTMALAKIGYTYTIYLGQGWNLITLPLETSHRKAEDLLQAINNSTHIARWNTTTSSLDIHEKGTDTNNFTIKDGDSYFVYVNASSSFEITGTIIYSVEMSLTVGWNSIGRFNQTEISASELMFQITNCIAIAYWNNTLGRFITYFVGTNISNFTIEKGEGYLVYVTSHSTWMNEW